MPYAAGPTTPRKRAKPHKHIRDAATVATRAEYQQMAAAAIEAIAASLEDIYLTFPWFVKFTSDGFPKGMCVATTMTTNTYKVKAKKLLDWLHKNGYSKVAYKDVVEARHKMLYRIKAIDTTTLDMEEEIEDNARPSKEATKEGD